MLTLRLGPSPRDRGEVATVPRDENATLRGRELEHELVLQTLEVGIASERTNVVPALRERSPDPLPGEVGVE